MFNLAGGAALIFFYYTTRFQSLHCIRSIKLVRSDKHNKYSLNPWIYPEKDGKLVHTKNEGGKSHDGITKQILGTTAG